MNAPFRDTIAAIATPPGRGGIGVIRISGSEVPNLITTFFGMTLAPRKAYFLPFSDVDGSTIDTGLALHFPNPHSFTGEDVLELQCHGSPIALDLILRRILSLGVRLARPGEFSERAFLNNKIDLAQAEAIADLIDSSTEQALRSAQRSLQGEFSKLIQSLVEELINLRIYVEASIDFVDEEIDFLEAGDIGNKLESLLNRLKQIQRTARQGCVLRDGLTVVIAGRPNAGKSSLLNRLAGRETAIVTDVAGTTRDLLREYIQIDGMPLHIIDTAGLRENADRIEMEGIRRARDAIANADLVLLVVDDCKSQDEDEPLADIPGNLPVIRIRNKIDITGRPAGLSDVAGLKEIGLSVKSGAGLDDLLQCLKERAGYDAEAGDVFIARRRHLDALTRSRQCIENGMAQLRKSGGALEILAEEIRQAQICLSEITGEFTSDELLGRIFSSFCIGK